MRDPLAHPTPRHIYSVGLCDEWPLVTYPDKALAGAFDYPFNPALMGG